MTDVDEGRDPGDALKGRGPSFVRPELGITESSFEYLDDWVSIAAVKNNHILVWWLPEYDDALRSLVEEYQWAWCGALLPHLEELIPEAVLRAWRDSDPLCNEYSWHNVLMNFAVARATELDIRPRPAERKICPLCGNEFLESDLTHSFVARIGVQNIDVCRECLEQALYRPGSATASPDAITGVLQALSEVLRRPLRTSDLSGRFDLRRLSSNERVLAIQALRVKPSLRRVKDLFGSWSAAIDHAVVTVRIPLPEYEDLLLLLPAISEYMSNDPAIYQSLMGSSPEIRLDPNMEIETYSGEVQSLIGTGYLSLAEAVLTQLVERDSSFYYFFAHLYGQTARRAETRAAIAMMGLDDGRPARPIEHTFGPRDFRTITTGPIFYQPLISSPKGCVRFVLVGGPMEYVDRRGVHRCITGEIPEGDATVELAESVARVSAMVDGQPWMQAAATIGHAIMTSLARTNTADQLYAHLVCYVSGPFRDIIKSLTGSLPKKLHEDVWSLGPVGKARWTYQVDAEKYVFNGGVNFRLIDVQAPPAVAIWGWPDRSDQCLQAFLNTVARDTSEPVTVILPDVPALRDFARRYVKRDYLRVDAKTTSRFWGSGHLGLMV